MFVFFSAIGEKATCRMLMKLTTEVLKLVINANLQFEFKITDLVTQILRPIKEFYDYSFCHGVPVHFYSDFQNNQKIK